MSKECTHFTADSSNTHSVVQWPHCVHWKGSICQTVAFALARPVTAPNTPLKASISDPRRLPDKKLRRFMNSPFARATRIPPTVCNPGKCHVRCTRDAPALRQPRRSRLATLCGKGGGG